MTIEELWQQCRDEVLRANPLMLVMEPMLRNTFYAAAYAVFAETLEQLADPETAAAGLMKLDAELDAWARPHLRASRAENN